MWQQQVMHLLNGLEVLRRGLGIRRVAPQLLQVQAVLLQMAGNILTSHAIHVHQLQYGLWDCVLDTLHQSMQHG